MNVRGFVLASTLMFGMDAWAEKYTNAFIANTFAEKDEVRGLAATAERKQELLKMMRRTASQCHNNLSAGQEAESVANMIVATRLQLEAANVSIMHYELLDVIYSALGDGRPDWDCPSVLTMYIQFRTLGDGKGGMTHIGAYKVIQGFRDNGLLGPIEQTDNAKPKKQQSHEAQEHRQKSKEDIEEENAVMKKARGE